MQLLKSEYYELPNKYNRTTIRLLVQSPKRMYVYWEVSDETISAFSKTHSNYSNCTPVLKITNLTKNYSYYIIIDPYANNYYIDVEDSGCEYQVELGRYVKKDFVGIYASNVATVPLGVPIPNYGDDALFANYLCIADNKKIKIFGNKRTYMQRVKQNHTDFENDKFSGSSENYLGSSENFIGSSENYLGSSENFSDSSHNNY